MLWLCHENQTPLPQESTPLLVFTASQLFLSQPEPHMSNRSGLAQQVKATGHSNHLAPYLSKCQVGLILCPSPPWRFPLACQSLCLHMSGGSLQNVCVCFFCMSLLFLWMTYTGQLLQGSSNLYCHFSWQLICHHHHHHLFLSLPPAPFISVSRSFVLSVFLSVSDPLPLWLLLSHWYIRFSVSHSLLSSLSLTDAVMSRSAANCTLVCHFLLWHCTLSVSFTSCLSAIYFCLGFHMSSQVCRLFSWLSCSEDKPSLRGT